MAVDRLGVYVIDMDWRHVLVASWRVDARTVAQTLPDGLEPDTYGGDAYLSVVPFIVGDVRPHLVPRFLGRTFAELNLRTYVRPTDGGVPGVYFYNLDASDPVGVMLARRYYDLPYYRAAADVRRWDETEFAFQSERTHEGVPPLSFEATYRPTGPAEPATEGSLDEFLFERTRFYTENDTGELRYGIVNHQPWAVAPAAIEFAANDLFRSNGFDTPAGDPHVRFSPGVEVRAGLPHTYEYA